MHARRNNPLSTAPELRERILTALRDLLGERRFDTLSVADIIAAAGVSRASFYFYFPGKQAALAELVRRAVGQGHEAAQPWVRAQAGPAETLRAGIEAGAALWHDNAAVLRAIVENWASDPQLRELWLTQMQTFTEATVARLSADPAADLRDADLPALAATLTWTGERLYYLAACGIPPFDNRTVLVDTLTHLWMSTLYPGLSRS
ncbi:TetR/AcrR family transcriptional regulator [Actinoplanes sp. Pm04-4]|uniref:TetR/AcrR family transcriptional regulator n=1 Tax=Paractinoplanes pyxinae TaxID=2997416 RepID=A0ABT4AZP5_9ACTN|nr:TetR/AcrR family transcriptional regulator [Actinoplanes pyxinae]MCY1139712.1 TetR/AcrR family transcriptional regulator [Actinoplanes pyxinae]